MLDFPPVWYYHINLKKKLSTPGINFDYGEHPKNLISQTIFKDIKIT